ncbi:hypothetical protein E2562_038613 [Oryza meyeriana var. granulata]|uniref:Uncharacterized protein n=1 Tax=Oryza meyeriana var. granulata TaxID=110450 RepID=A0A6G1CWN0_9ORYZ|nr:hypothetical protein E2562_038613 [Oryza meyeriana var. granulata]
MAEQEEELATELVDQGEERRADRGGGDRSGRAAKPDASSFRAKANGTEETSEEQKQKETGRRR